MSSLLSQDLDSLMRDYTETSILVHTKSTVSHQSTQSDTQTYRGLAEIRDTLAKTLELIRLDKGETLLVNAERIVDDTVIVKSWEIPSQDIAFGSDTICVSNGKITVHTVVTCRLPNRSSHTTTKTKRTRIAVLNANGKVGLATMRHLLREPSAEYKVIGCVRTDEGSEFVKASLPTDVPYEIRVGVDFSMQDTVVDAMKGIDRAIVIAPEDEKRAELAISAVTACAEAGVKHITVLSVFGAQYEAIQFARDFRSIEKTAESFPDTLWTHVRSAVFMDNLKHYQAGAINGQNTFYGSTGDGKFPPVAIDDVGRVIAVIASSRDIAEHAGQAYDITGPEALSANEQAAIMSEVLGRPITATDIPPENYVEALLKAGTAEWQAPGYAELANLFREGHAAMSKDDTMKLTGAHTSFRDWVIQNREVFGGA
jgi:uncharacterized protein YbjT (DUF2867 family)